MPDKSVTDAEAKKLEQHLRKMADQWRKRLEDPVTRQLIRDGTMAVSPLVKELLEAFPEKS